MMSTERLKILHRQEQTQRKFVCVMNDVAKTRQDLYAGYIEKEKQEVAQKCNKSIVVTRRNIVRQRVLKQCMKSKREEVEKENAKKIFGRYNGVPVEEIAEQVDPCIKKNHPKNRRQKKIDNLFHEGVTKGAILDDDTMHNKVSDYFERPLIVIQPLGKPGNVTQKEHRLPPVQKSFYTGDIQTAGKSHMRELLSRKQRELEEMSEISDDEEDAKEKLFVRRKVNKFLNEDVPDDLSVLSEATPSDSVTNRRGIRPVTLPPIKIGTDSEDGAQYYKKREVKTDRKDCIANVISRIHEAKENRERDIKIKKERRAKRIQHERVFGVGSYTTSESSRDVYTSQTERPFSEFVTTTPLHTGHIEKHMGYRRVATSDQKASHSGLRLPPIQR